MDISGNFREPKISMVLGWGIGDHGGIYDKRSVVNVLYNYLIN